MAVIWTEDFSSGSYTSTSDIAYDTSANSYLPNNWEKFSDLTNATNGMTQGYAWNFQYCGPGKASASWGDQKTDTNNRLRGWVIGYGTTGSGSTGPNGGSTSTNAIESGGRYLLLEATTQGSSSNSDTNRKRGLHLIRTEQIDLTSYSASETIILKGKYHAYGLDIGAFGVAVTTSSTSAGAANEAFTGSGFTGYTNDSGDGLGGGGCDIDYASSNGGTTINVTDKKRIVGGQQTSNGSNYNNFEVDMTGAGGQSVYIYFLYEAQAYYTYRWNTSTQHSNYYYRADFAIDKLSLETVIPADTHFAGKVFGVQGTSIANIYGEDLDENDKVNGTDGSGSASRTLDIVAAFDGAGSFYGGITIRFRLADGSWITPDSQVYTNQDNYGGWFSGMTGEALFNGTTNIAIWHTGYPPGGSFTLGGYSVTNTSGNLTINSAFEIGTTYYLTGNWNTAGTSELEIEWEA